MDDIQKTENTLSIQRLSINGVPVIFHKEKATEGIRFSTYFDAGDVVRKNRLYIFDPKDEELIKKIFRLHRFNIATPL